MSKEKVEKSTPISNYVNNSSSRNRNRSKTKSDKFTFLTINNYKINGYKLS